MLMASGLTVASAAFDATTFGNTTIEVAAKISIARIAFVVLRPDAVLNFTLFHLCKTLYPVLIRATFLSVCSSGTNQAEEFPRYLRDVHISPNEDLPVGVACSSVSLEVRWDLASVCGVFWTTSCGELSPCRRV